MFTVKQTALRMGVGVNTVRSLYPATGLRHVRIGLGCGTINIPDIALVDHHRPGSRSTPEAATPS